MRETGHIRFGVLRALHALGVSAPSQMSVVGFDGILLGDAMYPPLTTIYVSPRDIAHACIKALDHSKANVTREDYFCPWAASCCCANQRPALPAALPASATGS